MTETDTPTNPEPPRRRRPQFSIGGLLMLMVVCSVTAAAGSYLVRSLQRPAGSSRLIFILFTLIAPVVLMIVVNLIRQAPRGSAAARRPWNAAGIRDAKCLRNGATGHFSS